MKERLEDVREEKEGRRGCKERNRVTRGEREEERKEKRDFYDT